MFDPETETDEDTGYGPLDAMVRLSPPPVDPAAPSITNDLVFVERYGRIVVVRHRDPLGVGADVLRETAYPTEAVALRHFAHRVGLFLHDAYTPMED